MHPDDSNQIPPIFAELNRLFGDKFAPGGPQRGPVILPLLDEGEALAFLRGLPIGTQWEDLLSLASAWRAAHPRIDAIAIRSISNTLPNEG